jgi:hypothetical protein
MSQSIIDRLYNWAFNITQKQEKQKPRCYKSCNASEAIYIFTKPREYKSCNASEAILATNFENVTQEMSDLEI